MIEAFYPEYHFGDKPSSRTFVEVYRWYKDRYIMEKEYIINEVIEEDIDKIYEGGNPIINIKNNAIKKFIPKGNIVTGYIEEDVDNDGIKRSL